MEELRRRNIMVGRSLMSIIQTKFSWKLGVYPGSTSFEVRMQTEELDGLIAAPTELRDEAKEE